MRPERVTIVRNAPPTSWLERPVQAREGSLTDVSIVYVGAISKQDGVEGLAPVIARLCEPDSQVNPHLTIVGDGDGRADLEAEFRRYNVIDKMTLTGWVEAERVPELVDAADVCVDPAPATDVNDRSTMTKIAEYLALGKPVVAYDLRETRRTVQDAALLVPPGDASAFADRIATLALDGELRASFVRRARERAQEISWAHSERALLEAYASLVNGRPSS
jgi:glycosyltransferase involved in cell wall biosynthesis